MVDIKYVESLVPLTARPYLRMYLSMERDEADKELLVYILPLIPYDERADLIFDSFLNPAGLESDLVEKYVQEIEKALDFFEKLKRDDSDGISKIVVSKAEDVILKKVGHLVPGFIRFDKETGKLISAQSELTTEEYDAYLKALEKMDK